MPSRMCEGVETDLLDRAYGNEFVCIHMYVCMYVRAPLNDPSSSGMKSRASICRR